MRTAWGIFRATRMTGLADRNDFYQSWYKCVELETGEQLVTSWKVIRDPRSVFGASGGNLIMSDRHLIYEPMRNFQAAYGKYGTKMIVNALARYMDNQDAASPLAIPFADVRVTRSGTERMSTLTVVDRDGASAEFLLSLTRLPIGSRHRLLRDEALARISADLSA